MNAPQFKGVGKGTCTYCREDDELYEFEGEAMCAECIEYIQNEDAWYEDAYREMEMGE
jgi:hypothetical protein